MRRVCDACHVRRVACDGRLPCAACAAADLDCSRLRPRLKPGPKAIRKATLDRIRAAGRASARGPESVSQSESNGPSSPLVAAAGGGLWDTHATIPASLSIPLLSDTTPPELTLDLALADPSSTPSVCAYPYRVPIEDLGRYLDIYRHKLYPVWPIVDATSLIKRVRARDCAADAYMLASTICTATILQLQLAPTGNAVAIPQPQSVVDEIDDLRRAQRYRQHPTLDSVLISFFLHIIHLYLGQRMASTLLLREAASMAHLLDLHNPTHYAELPSGEAQLQLRTLWLLFITERAHATQYDLPCTVTISPELPQLNDAGQPFTLSAFISLCEMFAHFASVSCAPEHTSQSLDLVHDRLQSVPGLTAQDDNTLQRVDLCVTRHWMRLMLWKTAIPHIKMIADPSGNLESVLFPLQVARDLVSDSSEYSIDTFEAHGPGMELKLFALAISIADVMICLPQHSTSSASFSPREYLAHLARVLGDFRGGSAALLPILRSRLSDLGLSGPPVSRLIDVSHAIDGSGSTWPSSASNTAVNQDCDEADLHELSQCSWFRAAERYGDCHWDSSVDPLHCWHGQ
ncbi:hypothetical protein LTR53_012238 [Teratosphaeriaceae sp. CCFEE 6253]|nr:hypothetical protein LTR53_012238 [Teratosphaeriaceae sp. CCFEE 6253]